ncbi:T9SS type A sorting domain-containing protein [Membranicola marinus]|uniref:T9SS type A sorting domain-containing protein n=1 Tax=Membranihabitans marinus TaxID=1227546 RepID=A0A953HQ63_9BACT|nr:peroxidase family protein [Membranihabitans marinus]MBY5959737.1 T9SS type A sorting domain-containing protein [Membranihabitans marinus]
MNVSKHYAIIAFVLSIVASVNAQPVRSIDGRGNNLKNPSYGASYQPVRVLTSLDYSNGINSPAGWNRTNARTVSNELFDARQSPAQKSMMTSLVWAFGKFIEHDIAYLERNNTDQVHVKIPECDQFLDPECSGAQYLVFPRVTPIQGTGNTLENPRNVANLNTSWIDGSTIYGSDSLTAGWLRSGKNGQLKMSQGSMLPFNTRTGTLNGAADPDAPRMSMPISGENRHFIAGDPRANENLVVLALHTLFVREHNRICDELIQNSPGLTDQQVYEKARSIVVGTIQNIVFNEWLPAIGVELGPYRGYNPEINPTISNEFCAAGFKIWNTLQTNHIPLMDDQCRPHRLGSLQFNDLMYNPLYILKTNLTPLFKGLAVTQQLERDEHVIDEIRNFDYKRNGIQIKSDWITKDIIRGRERGIPHYNALRRELGLAAAESFSEITSDKNIQAKLATVYQDDINNIDAWVGLILEDPYPHSILGETMSMILTDQFSRLRHGDRFYFENDPMLSEQDRRAVRQTFLADVIRRNTGLTFLQDEVFTYQLHCLEAEVSKNHMAGLVFPNPVGKEMDLSVFSRKKGRASMVIRSTLGNVIDQSFIDLTPGLNLLHCAVDKNLSAGLYVIQITQGQSVGVIKFIKSN